MKTPQELQSIFDKFPKEKIELKGERVELAESIAALLRRSKGVLNYSKNIGIESKKIIEAKKVLKNDLKILLDEMGATAQGIERAEVAAKLLGIKNTAVPGYSEAMDILKKYGFDAEKLAKSLLK